MKITLKHLAVFEAIARTGTVSRGADQVFLTQSAASTSLRQLEGILGSPLFERSGKRLLLNAYGRALQARASNVLKEARDLEATRPDTPLTGTIRLTASVTLANYVLPKLCARFLKQHPGVRIDLFAASVASATEAVRTMAADFAFLEAHFNQTGLESESWARDELAFFVAPRHPLARASTVSLRAVATYPWFLHPMHAEPRSSVADAVQSLSEQFQPGFTSPDPEAVKTAVIASNEAVGCLSQVAIAPELRNGSIRRIKIRGLKLDRRFSILWRKAGYKPPLWSAFLDFARRSGK